MSGVAALLAIAVQPPADTPPTAAVALLSAIEAGDVQTARALLAEEATIADSSSGTGQGSSLEALSAFGRGCTHSGLAWEYDSSEPRKAAAMLVLTCPARPATQMMIWTTGPRVTWVQFGLPSPALETSE